jgi:RNA polymerase sigma-70 factor (family 1)
LPGELVYTEKELLCKVASGDEHAFKQLFKSYWPQVYGTGLHLTRSPEQSKDLAQDIFLKLWDNRSKLQEVERIEAYLYTISRNHIIDYLRKKVFHIANIDFLINYFQDDTILEQEHLEYEELENAIHIAITTLPGKVQDVFKLSRFEGLTHEQIAARLNISVVSSKTYIVRALRHIRSHIMSLSDGVVLLMILALSDLNP